MGIHKRPSNLMDSSITLSHGIHGPRFRFIRFDSKSMDCVQAYIPIVQAIHEEVCGGSIVSDKKGYETSSGFTVAASLQITMDMKLHQKFVDVPKDMKNEPVHLTSEPTSYRRAKLKPEVRQREQVTGGPNSGQKIDRQSVSELRLVMGLLFLGLNHVRLFFLSLKSNSGS